MKVVPSRTSNQTVGNIGLYYVCYELSKRGWNVMPTTRNAKGVDVVIYSQSADKKFTIQVKALSKRNPVPLGSSLNGLIADFVVICTNVADTAVPNTYIATPAEIARVAHRGEKNGNVSFWLQPPDYASFLNRWDLVGLGY